MTAPKPFLGNPQGTIAVLNRYHFVFQKKFGQNFLIDAHVLEKIIRAADITEDDFVGYHNVTILHNDVMKVDLEELAGKMNQGRPIKIVANLPYYITTPIIMGLFEKHVPLESITVMVQKEVADRMQVGPGSKDYGALSLAVQYYAEPYIVANVPANCFMPRPKVGSAVIRLTTHKKPPVEVQDEKLMFSIIRASFNQRRKTLQNGISHVAELGISKEQTVKVLEDMNLSPSIRGEAMTLQQFAEFTNRILLTR